MSRFPTYPPGVNLPVTIKEIWGVDHIVMKIYAACEQLFADHSRINIPMILGEVDDPIEDWNNILWLCSDAAGYMEWTLEHIDPNTKHPTNLPMKLFRKYLENKCSGRKHLLINPTTGKPIRDFAHEVYMWFVKRSNQ